MNRASGPLLVVVALLSGCLELEGRPCDSGDDCIAGYVCEQAICVKDGVTAVEPADLVLSRSATDLVILNPIGNIVVVAVEGEQAEASITINRGAPTLSFDDGIVEVGGGDDDGADLRVRLPRGFDVEVDGVDVEVTGRGGDVVVDAADDALGTDLGGALTVTSGGSASYDVELGGDVSITSLGGDIQLTVPADVDALLDAEGGSVVLENLVLSTGVNIFGRAAGTIGGLVSDHEITLRAAQGTIRLIGR